MLVTFVFGILLLTATLYALRGGFHTSNGLQVVGMDVEGIGAGVVAVIAAAWFFGPLYGLALILTVMTSIRVGSEALQISCGPDTMHS